MARLDKVKNITGLVEAFAKCSKLREPSNVCFWCLLISKAYWLHGNMLSGASFFTSWSCGGGGCSLAGLRLIVLKQLDWRLALTVLPNRVTLGSLSKPIK
ncbi:unnamed protein product [Urochloa humidicola]